MAINKRKDLGIGNFLDEVKADQTTTPRISAPDQEPEASVQLPETPYYGPATTQPQGMPYPSVGRPAKKQSLLRKKQAKLVYIDDETELQLRLIKTFQNYDYKEVIFTAIHEFMEHHYRDMRLDESGAKKVDKIIKEYKTRS
jgi:hypothetical protein